MLHTKFGSVVLEKKMLTDDVRWTTHDNGRQPIAIGHLSDSGDLKIQTSDCSHTGQSDMEIQQIHFRPL